MHQQQLEDRKAIKAGKGHLCNSLEHYDSLMNLRKFGLIAAADEVSSL